MITKTNCKGEYTNVDPNDAPCVEDLEEVTEVRITSSWFTFIIKILFN